MRITVAADGGGRMGFGHMSRCVALVQGFREAFPGTEAAFLLIPDSDAERFIKSHGMRVVVFDWQGDVKRTCGYAASSDVMMIDSYTAPVAVYEAAAGAVRNRIIMLDDTDRVMYPGGLVVSPSLFGGGLGYPGREGVIYLKGPEYVILRREFRGDMERSINRDIRNILVTFGGVECGGLRQRVASFLEEAYGAGCVIVDPSKRPVSTAEMLKDMMGADVCISGGGQTTYELARTGLPSIGISFAENQRLQLEAWRGTGFMEFAGRHDDAEIMDNIGASLDRLLPYEERVRRSEGARGLIDGRGVERIINTFLDLYGRKKKA